MSLSVNRNEISQGQKLLIKMITKGTVLLALASFLFVSIAFASETVCIEKKKDEEIIYFDRSDSDETVVPPFEAGRQRGSTDPLNAPRQKYRKSFKSSPVVLKDNFVKAPSDADADDNEDEQERPLTRSRTYSFCEYSPNEGKNERLTKNLFSEADFPYSCRTLSIESIPEVEEEN